MYRRYNADITNMCSGDVMGRILINVKGSLIPLRWWSDGKRLKMSDLEPVEEEARRIYWRERSRRRREKVHERKCKKLSDAGSEMFMGCGRLS